MDRQPDGGHIGRGPIDPVPLVGRDVDEITWLHLDGQFVAIEAEPGCPFEDNDEFGLILIVPEAGRRGVAVRDDPLDAHVGSSEERLDQFIRQVRGEVGEKIHGWKRLNPSLLLSGYVGLFLLGQETGDLRLSLGIEFLLLLLLANMDRANFHGSPCFLNVTPKRSVCLIYRQPSWQPSGLSVD